jgi:hypothetical protein
MIARGPIDRRRLAENGSAVVEFVVGLDPTTCGYAGLWTINKIANSTWPHIYQNSHWFSFERRFGS